MNDTAQTAWLRDITAYLIDLDGTLYRGNEVIPDAPAFIRWLQETGRQYLYVTNNSSRTPEKVAEHMRGLGIPADAQHVFTTSQVAAKYIADDAKQKLRSTRVFMLGEEGLRHALLGEGLEIVEGYDEKEVPGYVVQGIDRQFTYDKLKAASLYIQRGATFVATNIDKQLVTEAGRMPGSGSLLAALQTASGTEPIVVGKPAARMVEYAVQQLGIEKSQAVMLGDNLETDIAAGVNADVRTVLVLSGFSKKDDVDRSSVTPTLVVETLTDLMHLSS